MTWRTHLLTPLHPNPNLQAKFWQQAAHFMAHTLFLGHVLVLAVALGARQLALAVAIKSAWTL